MTEFVCEELRLVNCQIPTVLPDGWSVMVNPTLGEPVISSPTSQAYWRDCGFCSLVPPPDGMVWMARANYSGSVSVTALPALPDGEEYEVIPGSGGYYAHRLAVPSWCLFHPFRHQAEGPSVYECPRFCINSDGCACCNGSVYQECFDGGCSGENWYRVPVDSDHCLCATECRECGEMIPFDEIRTVIDGSACHGCRRRLYTSCDHCDQYVSDDDYDSHRMECLDGCECDDCGPSSNDLIQEYSYTPHLQFHGEGTYHLGLELELNTGRCDTENVAQQIADHFGDLVYLKEDSSINDGFEMVTHPMTLAYAKGVDWSILDRLREREGLRGSSDCGMHVHVSKTAFDTVSHTYRWMRLIYRNADAVQALARRYGSSYASFENYMNDWSIHYAAMSKKPAHIAPPGYDAWYLKTPGGISRTRNVGLPHGTARYSAINVENEKTFELRFFASTTRAVRVLAALEFVSASIEYARGLTAHQVVAQKGLDFTVFTAWVKDNNPDGCYANLISEIERLVP